jgi:hypothetical protein
VQKSDLIAICRVSSLTGREDSVGNSSRALAHGQGEAFGELGLANI